MGTGKISDIKLLEIIRKLFDFRPGAIIETLNYGVRFIVRQASYGHFGRTEKEFSWEKDG